MGNKLVSMVITITIAIILTATVLMPSIETAEEGQRITYNNEGYLANEIGTESVSYTWSAADGVTVGSETIEPNSNYGAWAVLMTDSGLIFANGANTGAGIFVFGNSVSFTAHITSLTVSVDPSTKTVTVSDIVAESTVADISFQYTTWALIPASAGDYITWMPIYSGTTKTIHTEEDSESFGTFINGVSWAITNKGDTVTKEVGISDYTTDFEGTSNSQYDGIVDYTLVSDGAGDYNVISSGTTYSPYAVAFESSATGVSSNNGETIISLFVVIPVLIIIGILVIAARSLTDRD